MLHPEALVLSERELRTLARIERHIADTDPALAQVLSTGTLPRPRWANPTALLVAGLVLLVFGSVIAAVPVAVLGITLAVLALFTAHHRPRLGPASA
jgi:hypothetical protein